MQSFANVKNPSLKNLHRPHFRLVSLSAYLAFILIFNLVIAPFFGLGLTPVYASDIDSNRLVELANQDRAQNGLSPLTVDQRLVNAATNKAIDMFKKQYWAHYGPNGTTPWQFIVGAGYNYTYAGENLAKDFSDTDSINTAWMNSSTHKANIMNVNYKNIGIAAVSGKQICDGIYPAFADNTLSTCIDTVIVVQMFGAPVATSGSTSPTTTKIPTTSRSVVTTTTPLAPSKPVITNPTNDYAFNTNKINISGKSDVNTAVSVYDGDKKIGTVSSDGGAFDVKDVTLEDGLHTLKANAVRTDVGNAPVSAFSDEVKIDIDTTQPHFEKNDIQIQVNDRAQNIYYIEGAFASGTTKVDAIVGDIKVSLQQKPDSTIFTGTIQVPATTLGIVLSATDKAGNPYTDEVKLPIIPTDGQAGLISSVNMDNDKQGNILTTKQIINIIVGVLILLIFIADSLLVWRTGRHFSKDELLLHKNIMKKEKGSFIHHVVPILIVVMAISFSFGGHII